MVKGENNIIGRKVAFTYKGKRYEKEIKEIIKSWFDTWIGDLGYEDDNDDQTDGFLIHGLVNEDKEMVMEQLAVQYDSAFSPFRHGYIREVEVLN
jgi:hypothetical protein